LIERGLVRVGDGCIHYRRGGCGPAIVALHASPRSSASLLPLIEALAEQYTVIALDTPGYGHSDPLAPASPAIGDFTRALGAAVDGLGLTRFALYGTHTGAAIAAAFALENPGRVQSLVLDGLAAFTPRERSEFLARYLVPFTPQWDGTHLAVLWSRVIDHFRWFPWYERTPAARLAAAMPSTEVVYETLADFLRAGDAYRLGYACAATFDAAAAVSALRVPTLLLAREHDLIVSHLDRVAETEHVRIARPGGAPEAWMSEIRTHFSVAARDAPQWQPGNSRRETATADRMLLPWGDGYLHLRGAGPGEATTIVVPDLPGSSAAALHIALPGAASGCRAWALDPPGCGASDPACDSAALIDTACKAVIHAQQTLGLGGATTFGVGLGAAVVALIGSGRVAAVPGWMTGRRPTGGNSPTPATGYEASGSSFLGSWYCLRESAFAADPDSGAPDVEDLQQRHTAIWTSPQCGTLARALHARVAGDATLRARIQALEGESN